MITDEEVRSWMKEHFLRTLTQLNGLAAIFTMHQNILVSGKFESCSADLKFFEVSSLKTPLGMYKHSLLRESDIISIDFVLNSDSFRGDHLMIELAKHLHSEK